MERVKFGLRPHKESTERERERRVWREYGSGRALTKRVRRERVFQSGESVWGEMTLHEFGERVWS
jgi:hypothetical protein